MNSVFLVIDKEYMFGNNKIIITNNDNSYWRAIVLESEEITVGNQVLGIHEFYKDIKEL